ncbi:Ataxin-3 [Trametes pubescens]|uniref:ubiquitinyl hydrolase 1 n=1 Tax=Trametes pubescens TaxID=154538 RepID=A0A1M2VE14_TRAPU|nr:Ataxin-3 [Trametes pubescens]
MSSIDSLIPLIYHEKQQEGSMLCAQHALNSLLQIARKLDETEHGYLEEEAGAAAPTSTNMDDTGFFSVQVLEEALKVWNLTLVRWRSEAMRPYQDHPHTQMGFILNQSQHWYALRRFGRVSPDPALDADPGDGHWFNLNSFLTKPERISKLYLGMFLQQAETEGYSVFAVVQRDPEGPLALSRTEADEFAADISESAAGNFTSRPTASASTSAHPFAGVEGLEDEDMELQAALQASLSGGTYEPPAFSFSSTRHTSFQASSSTTYSRVAASAPAAAQPDYEVIDDDDEDEDYVPDPHTRAATAVPEDPVAASMARQQAIMKRMQRDQQAALQEQYEEEIARFQAGTGGAQPPSGPSRGDDEDEMLRRAIAESEALAQGHSSGTAQAGEPPAPPAPPAWHQHRMYDDEDAELQAALRASLEGVPEGFRVPSPPPIVHPPPASHPAATSASAALQPPPVQQQASSDVDTESEADIEEPAEELSMEEIRKRRLARFGS